jgi:hypothetical protein
MPLLALKSFNFIYSAKYLFEIFTDCLVESLSSKNAFLISYSLCFLHRLICQLKGQRIESPNCTLFNLLTSAAISLPIQSIRLNTICLLNSYIRLLTPRGLYSLLLQTLPEADVKVLAFIIPQAKNLIISDTELNLELLWNVLTKIPVGLGDVANNIDRLLPTLNLFRAAKLAGKCPEEFEDKIEKYLTFIEGEIVEGRNYYQMEIQKSKNSKKSEFFENAVTQVDLVYSILQIVKKLFDQ